MGKRKRVLPIQFQGDSGIAEPKVKAKMVWTADGGIHITERGPECCWFGEEVASDDVEVPAGTICSLCEEEIK